MRYLFILSAALSLVLVSRSQYDDNAYEDITDTPQDCAQCHVNATCVDEDGSFKCRCNKGLSGNGHTVCRDTDECQLDVELLCGSSTSCINTFGSFFCRCADGYISSNGKRDFEPNDGTQCVDVDECATGVAACGAGTACSNRPGSYACRCLDGYVSTGSVGPFNRERDGTLCVRAATSRPTGLPAVVRPSSGAPATEAASSAVLVFYAGFAPTKPSTDRPSTLELLTTRPQTTRPQTTRPQTTRPQTTRPQTTRPQTTRPPTTRPSTFPLPITTEQMTTKSPPFKPHLSPPDKRASMVDASLTGLDCSAPPEVAGTRVKRQGTGPGAVALYNCIAEPQTESGPWTLVCGENGTWQGQHLACTGVQESTNTVAIVVSVAVATILAGLVAFIIRRRPDPNKYDVESSQKRALQSGTAPSEAWKATPYDGKMKKVQSTDL